MTTPRIEVDLCKLRQNTRSLVERLKPRGIGVTAVTKGVCGNPAIAQAMLDGGATGFADSRLSHIKRLRDAGLKCSIALIRSPMLSQVDEVVRYCNMSYNTEIDVLAGLSAAAIRANTVHDVILMVEMGDMREGILPEDLAPIVLQTAKLSGVALKGIATNFACFGGTAPSEEGMAAFSALVDETEGAFVVSVSGGNSASIPWALGAKSTGRVNELRLGEAILLGVDPLSGDPIDPLYTDAFTLIAEVIETKVKAKFSPLFGAIPALPSQRLPPDTGELVRSILAIGKQDIDVAGLKMPAGITYLGATSDHLVIQSRSLDIHAGSELRFQMNYSALMRGMGALDIVGITLDTTPSRSNSLNEQGLVSMV